MTSTPETGATDTMAQTSQETARATTSPTGQKTIQLTETAAGEVQKLITDEGRPDIALRIAVQPGGCSGLRYAMYLDDQVSEKDLLEEQFGVKVVVDKMSVPYLTQATIDWVDSLEASGFTIDNPAAQSSCACGNSFH
ncbi:MAG: HesB/IscA family protein [Actinomycetota bacterium]